MATIAAQFRKPCLYEVELSRVADPQVNKNLFLESLASTSNHLLNQNYLKSLSENPRNLLYVLTDPVELWGTSIRFSVPTIYCAIQVSLEGTTPNMPVGETLGKTVRNALDYFYPRLSPMSLVVAHIVNFFKIEEPAEDYGLTAMNILTSFYNGEEATVNSTLPQVPLTNLQRKWTRLHYIGVYSNLTIDSLSMWEKYNFSVLFAGNMKNPEFADVLNIMPACVMIISLRDYELEIVAKDVSLSLGSVAEDSRRIFINQLYFWPDLDHQVALRIFENYRNMIPKMEPAQNNPWKKIDQMSVEGFVQRPNQLVGLITHLVKKLAEEYFLGNFPFQLSRDTEYILLLIGLQYHTIEEAQTKLQIERDRVIESLRQSFAWALNYYNTLLPQVLDPPSKRQKT